MRPGRKKSAIPPMFQKTQKGGKNVYWYYWVYDESGVRRFRSTGCIKKSDAMKFIRDKIEADDLSPLSRITFEKYAKGFFDWPDSPYILERNRKGGRKITQDYAKENSYILAGKVMERFGPVGLDEITGSKIDQWTSQLLQEGKSTSTVKKAYLCLNTILQHALRKGLINRNPFEKATPITVSSEEKGTLTLKEARDILKRNLFDNDQLYLMNLIAALTGLRLGELCALKVDSLANDRLLITQAKRRLSGVTDGTKNKQNREVPLLPEIIKELAKLRSSGYLFSLTLGETPIDDKWPRIAFYSALGEKFDRSGRGITFHSWRHFFNTQLQAANVTDAKVKAVMGHSGGTMTERYTHFKAEDMSEIYAVQQSIIEKGPEGPLF